MNKHNKKETDLQIQRPNQCLPEQGDMRGGRKWLKGIKRYKLSVIKSISHMDVMYSTRNTENIFNNMVYNLLKYKSYYTPETNIKVQINSTSIFKMYSFQRKKASLEFNSSDFVPVLCPKINFSLNQIFEQNIHTHTHTYV